MNTKMTEFKTGYIFGEEKINRETVESRKYWKTFFKTFKKSMSDKLKTGPWGYYNTRLAEYSVMHDNEEKDDEMNFENFLELQVVQARKEKRALNILDVGIAQGKQWIDFMNRHGDVVKLHASGIDELPTPEIKVNFKRSTADLLHKKFKPIFDIVVTHVGIHGQPHAAIENIIHLLKPGGTAFITSNQYINHNPVDLQLIQKFATIYKNKYFTEKNTRWTLRLQKTHRK